jgi:hypothetical protein
MMRKIITRKIPGISADDEKPLIPPACPKRTCRHSIVIPPVITFFKLRDIVMSQHI